MRFVLTLGTLSMMLTGCNLNKPVEQTSKPPMANVTAHARGKAVIEMCKKLGKTDQLLCKGVDALGEQKAGDGAHGHH